MKVNLQGSQQEVVKFQDNVFSSVVTVIETGTETAVFSSKPNRSRPTLASMKP